MAKLSKIDAAKAAGVSRVSEVQKPSQ